MRIIACIEDAQVIGNILAHQDAKASQTEAPRRPPCRAPPQRGLFDEPGADITLERTQTIMSGGSHCDFRWKSSE